MNGDGCLHRAGKKRRCKRRGCKTWLTSYNQDSFCCEHGGWRAQREANADTRKGRETRGEMLAEILEVV